VAVYDPELGALLKEWRPNQFIDGPLKEFIRVGNKPEK
jgi:hypothetical protein